MPPYRVKLALSFEDRLASWSFLPTEVTRSLLQEVVDILEHQSAFSKLQSTPDGHLLPIDVGPYRFLLFVAMRDETFYVIDGAYTCDE